jgi:hypothetical protein
MRTTKNSVPDLKFPINPPSKNKKLLPFSKPEIVTIESKFFGLIIASLYDNLLGVLLTGIFHATLVQIAIR